LAIVTFSREAHSGTQDLARLLAQRLGYRYVARDALTRALADASGVAGVAQGSDSEGRPLSFWEQWRGNPARQRAVLTAVVAELALEDGVVMVGHGAGQIFTPLRTALRVFVVDTPAHRARRLVDEGMDPSRARRAIADEDRVSASYLRYLFGIDWRDPHHWDLVLNMARLDAERAADLIAHDAASLSRDADDQRRLDQLRLRARLELALHDDADLGVGRVRVTLTDDRVLLEGDALAPEDRQRAETTVARLAPGLSIDNRIVVRPRTLV
jgi:cytidylate kinase